VAYIYTVYEELMVMLQQCLESSTDLLLVMHILTYSVAYRTVFFLMLWRPGLLSREFIRSFLSSLLELRTILSVSRTMQIIQHISNEDAYGRIGMLVLLGDIIFSRRLCWLGSM